MISIVHASDRFHYEEGWLSTNWHFSFDHYYDQKNVGWGKLRVFNDDTIMPGGKFPMHPHANFEIITIVLEGEIKHMDSAGHEGIVGKDEVQATSAGKGLMHSEENCGNAPLHLLQVWIEPQEKGTKPWWKKAVFKKSDFEGKLCALASGAIKAPLAIGQKATIFRCALSKGKAVEHVPSGEFGYLFVIEGAMEVNGEIVGAGDSVKMRGEKLLRMAAVEESDFVLFDLP